MDESRPSSSEQKINAVSEHVQPGNLSKLDPAPLLDKFNFDKKKQPPFLEREIKVLNPGDIDHVGLLKSMQERFRTQFFIWKKQASIFKLANLIVTILVILLQITQVVMFQLSSLDFELKSALATILPAVTGAILAVQLKLAWSEKGAKCKRAARTYNTLAKHMDYRLAMNSVGGYTDSSDAVKIWNTALLSESKEIPAFLSCY